MEAFVKAAAIALCAAVFGLCLKKDQPQIAFVLSLCAGIAVLIPCVGVLSELRGGITKILSGADIQGEIFSPLIKICCLSAAEKIICEICRDSGERALAEKLSLFSKAVQTALMLPLLSGILQSVGRICSKI